MKPILFNTDMVRAILGGRKTVTRRAVKGYALDHLELDTDGSIIGVYNQDEGSVFKVIDYAPYRPGDILYVRETWCWCYCWDCGMDLEEGCCDDTAKKFFHPEKLEWGCYGYKASFADGEAPFGGGWRPSIHMPREAARIFLRVTEVQVERLQDISYEDCLREGITDEEIDERDAFRPVTSAKWLYAKLWDSTIKPAGRNLYGWAANPWVWVIEFERISKEEAAP